MDAVEQLVAQVALKKGLVTEDQMREASAGGGPLGRALVERGYLKEKHYSAILDHVQRKVAAAFGSAPDSRSSSGAKSTLSGAEGLRMSGRDTSAHPERSGGGAAAAAESKDGAAAAESKDGAGHMPPIPKLLERAKKMGASDLHISVTAKPFVRLHGVIHFIEDLPALTPEATKQRIYEVLSPEQRAVFERRLDLDTCLEFPGIGRFRTSVLTQRRGIGGVFRVIRDRIPTLEELGMPEVIRRFTTYHQGIVLVTGAAGSGKSSTLAALIEIVNQVRKDHVITLEDPIEYVFECKKANVSQRQIESHTLSWANALRAALREDPDVIMVGEMRDLDTMRLAITAAETGHLVLATLHTTNATRTIDRLLDVFPPKEQPQIRAMVSESLRGIVCQQLVPRADGKGRAPAVEVLFTTPAVANLVRERKTFQLFSVLQTGKKLGMRLMDDSLAELVEQGVITRDQARFRAQNPRRFAAEGRK